MQLLLDDVSVTQLADRAFASLDDIKAVAQRQDLPGAEEAFARAVSSFIEAA